MTWQHGPQLRQYTLTVDTYQALVWHQAAGQWAAIISHEGTAINSDTFETLMDAQMWCEGRLAKLQAKL